MSDIVKRLRVRRNPMLDGEREEAAAEIERLREVESNVTAAMVEWERRWRATALENERLRERLQEAAKLNMELMEIRRENEAEIQQLRGLGR